MDDMFLHQQATDMHNQAHQAAVDMAQQQAQQQAMNAAQAGEQAMDMAQQARQSMQNLASVGRRNVGLVAIATAATVAVGAAIYASFKKKREFPAIKEAAEGNEASRSR